VLTFEQISELIELVARHGLAHLELERSGFRLEIDGPRDSGPAAGPIAPAAERPAPELASSPAASGPPAAEESAGGIRVPEGSHVLTSPIVGTFYRKPNPDSQAYAEVGDRVRKGQVVCIVEAMKLMNEIESDIDGVIVEIYPQNAQAVEFGEPLFAIQPG